MRELGDNQAAFCRRIGVAYSSVQNVLGPRGSKPSGELLEAIAAKTPVNPAWLLTGQGSMFQQPEGGQLITADEQSFELLPLMDIRASAGSGEFVVDETVKTVLAFRADWVRDFLRGTQRDFYLIQVSGDSMDPTLRHGDVVLVDRRDQRMVEDGLYVYRFDDTIHVKRLQRVASRDAVRIISDNPAYPPDEINAQSPPASFAILGRVKWSGRMHG